MSFRARLLLGLALAVVLAAGVQSVVGYTLYRRWLEQSAHEYVGRFLRALTPGVVLGAEQPAFDLSRLTAVPPDWSWVRYRVLAGDEEVLTGPSGESYPARDPLWTRGGNELEDGYRFEVALNLTEIRQSLRDYQRTTVTTLALTLIFALLLIALFFRFSMRPIERLTAATQSLARRHFPEPVEVPPGNDEVATLAHSFNEMAHALQSFVERERSFTRYASHELRTPLSTFRAQVDALELGLLPRDDVIATLKATIARMQGILGGLLTLARSSNIPTEPLALEPLLGAILETLPPEARSRVRLELSPQAWVVAQPDLLRQALGNLLDNALNVGRVVVRLEPVEAELAVVVCDDGPGIPSGLLARVTEPFFQLDASKGGVGLGLALVQHIATSLGGRLELRNVEGGFEARLVLRRAEPA